MENCKIIEYTPEYKEQFFAYLHKTFPSYSPEYLEYSIEHSLKRNPSELSAMLILNEKGEIVGCHQYYNSRALIKGNEETINWGFNTYIDEKYRKDIGLEFIMTLYAKKGFGIGLSEINREIHKKIKTTFFDGLYNYCQITPRIIYDIFYRVLPLKTKSLDSINNVKTKQFTFNRVTKSNDMRIPNNGFWYKDHIDVDFVRDSDFLNRRFFANNVFEYQVFQIADEKAFPCYFVIRTFKFKSYRALYLVDFRYEYGNINQLDSIFKALNIICKKIKCGVLFWTSNDPLVARKFANKKNVFKRYDDLLATRKYHLNKDNSIIVTAADSDVDFLR